MPMAVLIRVKMRNTWGQLHFEIRKLESFAESFFFVFLAVFRIFRFCNSKNLLIGCENTLELRKNEGQKPWFHFANNEFWQKVSKIRYPFLERNENPLSLKKITSLVTKN